jgi:beta-N-acetylglucosaminidase
MKKNKNIIIFFSIVFTSFIIKIIFFTGLPDANKNPFYNFMVGATTPTPIPIHEQMQIMSANFQQEKLILKKEIEDVKRERDQIKASRGELERREELRKQKVIQAINNNLGGVFKNKGDQIYKTCKLYSVNPMMLTAIIKHETSNGTSDVVKNANNPGGINWYKGCGYPKYGWYQKYPSIDVGIEKMARLIKTNYIDEGRGDIVSIGLKYAPPSDPRNGIGGMDNTKWATHVTNKYLQILKEAEG